MVKRFDACCLFVVDACSSPAVPRIFAAAGGLRSVIGRKGHFVPYFSRNSMMNLRFLYDSRIFSSPTLRIGTLFKEEEEEEESHHEIEE